MSERPLMENIEASNCQINRSEYEIPKSDSACNYGTNHRSDGGKLSPNTDGYVRYVMAILCFFGLFVANTAQRALVTAIVAMVNTTSTDRHINDTIDRCPATGQFNDSSSPKQKSGEFNWNVHEQSLVMSMLFYGTLLAYLPSGVLAERFGGKIILGTSILVSSLLAVSTPFLAQSGVVWLMASRFFIGLFQAAMAPACNSFWGKWSPPLERSKLLAISNSGAIFAIIVSIGFTGYLCSLNFLGGWPLPFYLFGGLGCVWFCIWMVLASSYPIDNRWLSSGEKYYIESSVGPIEHQSRSLSRMAPWKSILTSRPVIAMTISKLLCGTASMILYLGTPVYMKIVLNTDITHNGLLLALPHVAALIGSIFSGWLCDFVLQRKWLSVTKTRKTFSFVANTIRISFIIGMGFVDCDLFLAVLFLVLASGFGEMDTVSVNVSSIDIAPQYAGITHSLINSLDAVGGIIAEHFITFITNGQASRTQWQKVFFLSAGMTLGSMLVYLLFGTSERQPWAIQTEEDNNSPSVAVCETRPLISA